MLDKLLDSTAEAAQLRSLVVQLERRNQDQLEENTRLRQENVGLQTERDKWRSRADMNDKEMSEVEGELIDF